MICQLDKSAYERTRALFTELDHQLTAQAVIEGRCPGNIWVDRMTRPRAAFMASPEGHFLVGHGGDAAFHRALNKLIMSTFLGEDADGQRGGTMVLVCHPEGRVRQFDVVLAGLVAIPEHRWHYLEWNDLKRPKEKFNADAGRYCHRQVRVLRKAVRSRMGRGRGPTQAQGPS